MHKANHIVFTTINYPTLLNDYFDNLTRHNHLADTKIWVVGDLKTPVETRHLCEEVTTRGLEVVYLGIEEQENQGKLFPEFYSRLPFNNETRRNLGFLAAYADGCERLISIDDDNFPTVDDFIGGHMVAGCGFDGDAITTSNGFFNVCSLLEFEPARVVYPRGFPFLERGRNIALSIQHSGKGTLIGANAGLWLAEPDVDATTWLNGKIFGTKYLGDKTMVLGPDTWTPINTQNTSVIRDLIPAYLCIPMGWDVPGGKIQRYGDIWGGYFLQALMKGLDYRVAVGRPIVEHRRNPHNYLDDMRSEYWGMVLTDWLLQLLRTEFHPKEPTILLRVFELVRFIREIAMSALPTWCPEQIQAFLIWTSENLDTWAKALQSIDEMSHGARTDIDG